MQCIFFTEQSYTDQRFGRLCNQVLPKTLRFSLQRHKAPEFGLRRILGWFAGFLLLRLETPVLLAALCKSSRILQSRILGEFAGSRLGTWHAVSGFGLGLLVRQVFLGAKAPLYP